MFAAERLDHIGFTARDIHSLAAWYRTVFGMTPVHEDAWPDVDEGRTTSGTMGSATRST